MTPEKVYLKCLKENKRFFFLEHIILQNEQYSFYYARDIIKGRWEEAEKIISTDPLYSYHYARDVIKRRFLEGEKIIANHLYYSYLYARNIIKGMFPLCHYNIFYSLYKDKYIDFLKSINYDLSEIEEWLI